MISSSDTPIPFFMINKFTKKDTVDFHETTPDGNIIDGKVLLSRDKFHGSLLIEKVNDETAVQIVRGFPKINYINKEEPQTKHTIFGYEKLDGTCVGLYNLFDHNGNFLELVPKSRQKAVLDEHFQEMLKLCDTRLVEQLHYKYDAIYFEMFGMLNEHTLPHKQTYIDIRLIGGTPRNSIELYSPQLLEHLSKLTGIDKPKKIVSIDYLESYKNYYLTFEDQLFADIIKDKIIVNSDFNEVCQNIENTLDICNQVYKEEKGYLKYEGVVLQIPNKTDYDKTNTLYIKIKPDSFKQEFGVESELKISLNEIKKEVYKIINENLTTYIDEYNEKEAIKEINDGLLEEFDESDVKHSRTQKVIIKELRKYIDSINDKSISRIVDEVLEENPTETNPANLMKYFASHYPMMKHRSSDVYYILNKRVKKRVLWDMWS